MTLKHISIFVAVFLIPAGALCNDAAYHGVGSAVFAYKEQRVRMVSEHIRIRRSPDPKFPKASWVADCRFEFENLNDAPVKIEMGFPDAGGFPSGEWTIKAFTTTINKRGVAVRHKIVDPNHGHERSPVLRQLGGEKPAPAPFPADYDPDGWRAAAKSAMKAMNIRFAAAYTWQVSFKPKERIVVENRYRFGGANANGPITMCTDGLPMPKVGGFWYTLGKIYDFGSSSCSIVTYVVTTGGTWHGPIGEALIEIEVPAYRPPNHVIPVPPATEVTARWVRWHFKDFTPTQELRVLFAHSRHFEEHRDHGYLDFPSPRSAQRWLKFATVNGFTKDALKRMGDLQRYSFGLRNATDPLPSPFVDRMAVPEAESPRTLDQLTSDQRAILGVLDDGVRRARAARH